MLNGLKRLLTGKEIADFNAVIEGTYHDEWTRLNYKITNLSIPENVTAIKDGTFTYLLTGKTTDFKEITSPQSELKTLESSISSGLWCCPGVVLPYNGGLPNILERPRAIVFRDGRIFVEDHMKQDEGYVNSVPSILDTAGELFSNKKASDKYREIMANCNFTVH